KGFSSNETVAISEFIDAGQKVLIFADNPSSSNHTALNQLLFNHSIQFGGTVTSANTTELHPSSPITQGVTRISTHDGTTLTQTGNAETYAWVNGTPFGVYQTQANMELFVSSCSATFSNTYLYQLDNLRFTNQTLNQLFRRTISLSINTTGGNGSTFYIGNNAGFIIDAHNSTGHGVEGLDMFIIFTFPNRTQTLFFAFEVRDGRYGSFIFANWTGLDQTINTTQTFTIIALTLPGTYGSTSSFMYFYYEPAPEAPPPPPEPNFLAIMELQIIISSLIAALIVGGYFFNQYRRRRRMRTPTLDNHIIQNIENTLNTTHALIREMEWTLTDRRMDRIEKLRIISGQPTNRLESMLKRLRELAKESGV
ncbi:MAG: hypothetical protein ACFFD8_09120, partial [Candidatus Thorarchaeota archaeon]